MSRLQHARQAVRPSLPARAVISGPPGAGKTRTALIVAEILAEGGSIVVIDTEKESALTYADDFDFTHVPWHPPYDPRELATDILAAGEEHAVVIVDSMSHFWRGPGGTLDIAGGKFTGWKDARPAQMDLVDAILGCRAHFIGCARAKVDHVQEIENGKHVVRKLGMAVIQDDELEYELNVAVDIDMTHTLTVSKSRTVAVPVGRTFTAGHAEEFATLYRDWLRGGEPPAPGAVVAGLVERMNALDAARRKECKAQFLAELGRPDHLRASSVDDAERLVAKYENAPAPEPEQDSGPDAPGVTDALVGDPEHAPNGGDDTEGSRPNDVPSPPDGPPITDPQVRALNTALHNNGIAGPARLTKLTQMLGRDIDSTKSLTKAEATWAIDELGFDKTGDAA